MKTSGPWRKCKYRLNQAAMVTMISIIRRDRRYLETVHRDMGHHTSPHIRARRFGRARTPVKSSVVTLDNDVRQFLTAFAGAFVFLSIMIF